MVSVLASITVDCWFEPWSGQTKDYEIGICCFSAKHAALRRKSKDWLARNQDNVSEWDDFKGKITELTLNNNHLLTQSKMAAVPKNFNFFIWPLLLNIKSKWTRI